MVKAAEAAEVVVVAVTEMPSEFRRFELQLGKRPLVRVALGFHPLRAAAASPMELALFAQLLDRVEYVGEVGLDRSPQGRTSFRQQVKVFEHMLQQPRIKNKVLTVHSRGAEKETIERLASAQVTAILHWYSGALKYIDDAVKAGLWFSVNSAMLTSKNGQRIVRSLPKDRIVTETDGPYARFDGRVSEPRDIPTLVKALAQIWGEEPEQARERVFQTMSAVAFAAKGERK